MIPSTLTLVVLPQRLAICRLEPDAPIPPWAANDGFFSVTRTADELSVVCNESAAPAGIRCEKEWRCLRVAGALPFSAVGVLAALTLPLAEADISVFVLSTFDTDYLLVKAKDLEPATDALRRRGVQTTF